MNPSVSRRGVLGGVAAIFGTALCVGQPSVSQDSSSDSSSSTLEFADRAVTLLGSSHPSFSVAMDQYFPSLAKTSGFQSVKSSAAILIHRKGRSLRAVSTEWRIATENQTFQTYLFNYSLPGTRRYSGRGRAISSAGANILRSGDARLLTPFLSLGSRSYMRIGQVDLANHFDQREPARFIAHEIQNGTCLTPIIDACLFSDGKVYGNDRSDLLAFIQGTRNGEREEGTALAALVASSGIGAVLRAALIKDASAQRSTTRDWQQYCQEEAKARYARFLYRILNDRPRNIFEQVIQRAGALSPTVLHHPTV